MSKSLFLYRKQENGSRLRVEIKIDDEMTILSEDPTEEQPFGPATKTADPKTEAPIGDAYMDEAGIERTVTDGKILITSVPPRESKIFSFFSRMSPCWFEGCEELKTQYFEELQQLKDAKCKACDEGKLIRKYRGKINEIWPPTADS